MDNTTTILLERIEIDDTIGAIIFIIVVLLWYSLGVVFLLGMKIGAPSEIIEDSIEHSNKLFTQSFRDKTNNKCILEELVNKEKRDKLWDIYLGSSKGMNEKIIHGEVHRIRNIQRQLSSINEHCDNSNSRKKGQFSNRRNFYNSTSLLSVPCTLSSGRRFPLRRLSLLDDKPFRECENMTDEFKTHEYRSSSIHKLFSRRHSRQ